MEKKKRNQIAVYLKEKEIAIQKCTFAPYTRTIKYSIVTYCSEYAKEKAKYPKCNSPHSIKEMK